MGVPSGAPRRSAALADAEGVAGFGLLCDARNRFFAGAGEWPGWVGLLEAALSESEEPLFASLSWQELLAVASRVTVPVHEPERQLNPFAARESS